MYYIYGKAEAKYKRKKKRYLFEIVVMECDFSKEQWLGMDSILRSGVTVLARGRGAIRWTRSERKNKGSSIFNLRWR